MNWTGLARRLEAKFGLGEFPMIRRRLYTRLERACEQHGDAAYIIVCDCGQAALTKGKPGNWFSSAVSARLKEAGFLGDPPTDPAMQPAGNGGKPGPAGRQEVRNHVQRTAEGFGDVGF
jgi:hypothetical protein